jgi:hypothetical protein
VTLDKLRELAEKAKAWQPDVCRDPGGSHSPCDDKDACLGAQRAVEDINRHVCDAVSYIATLPRDPLRDGDTAATKLSSAEYEAHCATRIASYFGSPGPVAAFEAGVREMCRA